MFTFSRQTTRRTAGFALTLAVHAAFVVTWRMSRQAPPDQPAPSRLALFVPLRQPTPPVEVLPAPASRAPVRNVAASPAPAAGPPESIPTPVQTPVPDVFAEPSPQPAPASPAQRMLEEAKRVVPGIAREIRDERKRRGLITAPPDSPHIRMSKGIAKANEIAPPKWYQAPKVTEIIDPGGYGRRRYRVITGLGEYCLTYEGVYSPSAKQSTQPVITSCDKNEQAATKQEW